MMATRQFSGSKLSRGLTRRRERNGVTKGTRRISLAYRNKIPEGLGCRDVSSCCLSMEYRKFLSPLLKRSGRLPLRVAYDPSSSGVQERSTLEEELALNSSRDEQTESVTDPIDQPHPTDVERELIKLSLPAIAGQAIDPLAQLMETAYIGRLAFKYLS
ncbi:uncharacterized protein LOC105630074 isoform X3 [Jatropha curcas]|uniref:uncharacterized protein LOC105630074 isoform X3 n=1 Tax=Jatropha curcas TaxID=180498 RepID=UPI0009D6C220|nr:uncharacterized protein LOC105630074 isoform X3 [Jatropha curcas]